MKQDLVKQSEYFLSDQSPFTELVNGFHERPQQKAMAVHIAQAIMDQENTFVAEASTGIGKTFAYLIPALLSGQRTVVSTYTRHLQDQIYFKDLPMVLRALDVQCDAVLLKGRSNYLCIERLERALDTLSMFGDEEALLDIKDWAATSETGDLSLFEDFKENDPLRPSITSTPDNCLGSKCPCYEDCFVVKARSRAAKADLVIVNHNLLISDMVLKEDGFGELLPDVDTVIIDEAHKLKTVSEQSFADRLTSGNMTELFNEIRTEMDKDVFEDDDELTSFNTSLDGCRQSLHVLTQTLAQQTGYQTFRALLNNDGFVKSYQQLQENCAQLTRELKSFASQTEVLGNLHQRSAAIDNFLQSASEDDTESLVWVRNTERSFQIYRSPLDVSRLLSEKVALYEANWIYTSATLTVEDSFEQFLKSQGLSEDSECQKYESPFDYREQACLYLPKTLPEPNHPEFVERMLDTAYPLLQAMGGRTFLLFTSYRNMQKAYEILLDKGDYEMLLQGEMPKMDLLKRFGDGEGRLLLGTSSFWEGVDVKGPALSCIVIDKLPFAHPGDPLTQARMKRAAENNINYFKETSLLDAVIMLRQGVGRLIRSETDTGVVMIADKRLYTRSYGKAFIDSLPPMKRYTDFPPAKFMP